MKFRSRIVCIYFFAMALLFNFDSSGQNVGINNDKSLPHPSAMLDIYAADKGLLIPRVDLTNHTDNGTIPNPAYTLLVYNYASNANEFPEGAGFYYNANKKNEGEALWVKFMEETVDTKNWVLKGNTNVDDKIHFLGTATPADVVFKRDNIESLRFTNGGALLATGSKVMGKTPASGVGSRLMWIPQKAAFRVGEIDEFSPTAWDDINVGKFSFAAGANTWAKGEAAIAMGNQCMANSIASTALGYAATASGDFSTSIGFITTAGGNFSFSVGKNSFSSGMYSVAMGYATKSKGKFSVAVGEVTTAGAYGGLAMGKYNDPQANLNPYIASPTDKIFQIGDGVDINAPKDLFYIRRNGDVYTDGYICTPKGVSCPSDIRLKEKVVPLKNVLNSIESIQPISYYFKSKEKYSADHQIGFSAQEIEKEFPELIRKTEDGFLAVNYPQMTAVAIQAIKEQQKIIKLQEEKMYSLEERIKQLEKIILAK